MTRYYFDTDAGEHLEVDTNGYELTSFDAARDEAIRVLPSLANDVFPNGPERTIVSIIR